MIYPRNLHAYPFTHFFLQIKTLEIIERIWAFRKNSKCHICFTLDAGANVHVLFPHKDKELVDEFIKTELASFCENNQFISDQSGSGAKSGTNLCLRHVLRTSSRVSSDINLVFESARATSSEGLPPSLKRTSRKINCGLSLLSSPITSAK